jgi:hypothetical protein
MGHSVLVPMVVEKTSRGERAYDIYSRLRSARAQSDFPRSVRYRHRPRYALLNGHLNRLLDQLGILSARQNHQGKPSRRDLVGDFELNDRRRLLGH